MTPTKRSEALKPFENDPRFRILPPRQSALVVFVNGRSLARLRDALRRR